MSEYADYTEPSNDQLANFMSVLARSDTRFAGLQVSPAILEWIFDQDEEKRQMALRRHREFQESVNSLSRKIQEGTLGCQHVRPNGKQCPNANEPGRHFCGLHGEDEDAEEVSDM